MLVAKLIARHLPPEADADLVIRALACDPGAFDLLYLRYLRRISSMVGRMLPNASESEEVTQEVFLQVYLSLPRFEGRSSFYTWIYRVARNVALHHIRASSRRYRIAPLSEALEATLVRDASLATTNPERDAEYNALLAETNRVIEELIPSLREVMVLGPVNGGSCEEVADFLGVRTEVVKSRLHRARVSAKEAMWRVERRGVPVVLAPIPIPVPRLIVVPAVVVP
jgi:RNA polymerase sigma-70 factor (ECF subfamily)